MSAFVQAPAALARSASGGDVGFSVLLAVGVTLAAFAFARRHAKRARGRWTALSFVPAVPWAFVAIRVGWDTAHDPTSHNLWPFEFVFVGVPCAIAWWIIGLVQRRGAAPEASA
ncbi:MAG: hypothetical protein HY275_17960 [Gemmatimonadetes bacterium]|nr:hypothetical protein [Gemmatimonadota bacterium]